MAQGLQRPYISARRAEIKILMSRLGVQMYQLTGRCMEMKMHQSNPGAKLNTREPGIAKWSYEAKCYLAADCLRNKHDDSQRRAYRNLP